MRGSACLNHARHAGGQGGSIQLAALFSQPVGFWMRHPGTCRDWTAAPHAGRRFRRYVLSYLCVQSSYFPVLVTRIAHGELLQSYRSLNPVSKTTRAGVFFFSFFFKKKNCKRKCLGKRSPWLFTWYIDEQISSPTVYGSCFCGQTTSHLFIVRSDRIVMRWKRFAYRPLNFTMRKQNS